LIFQEGFISFEPTILAEEEQEKFSAALENLELEPSHF